MKTSPAADEAQPDDAERIVNVVIGTAGHIDHGKSLLVQRLTGIDPDRLKEEKQRGITIDLGFAPLILPNGLRVGMIDVPGHERFVKNMIAGATGIDLVLLVVAADDGVMPQTREHLEIVELLGVRRGVVAITKIDLVDRELVELVEEDVASVLVGTPLAEAPVFRVSSVTGDGIDALRAGIEAAVAQTGRRATTGPFRMPIQRVFSKAGFGAVVTGVPLSGKLEPGARVEILPTGERGRVKGLQAYSGQIAFARAGHSTAVNLAGIDYRRIRRGYVAAEPGIFTAARLLEARLHVLKSQSRPLAHRTPIRFHAGTSEVLGRVLLLEDAPVKPGSSAPVQLALNDPVVVAPGDRFVLRRQSPVITLAGGVILAASDRRLRRGRTEVLQELAEREKLLDKPDQFAAHLLEHAAGPLTTDDLVRSMGQRPDRVRRIADELIRSRRAVRLSEGRMLIAVNTLEGLCQRVRGAVTAYFRDNPKQQSVALPTIRARLPLSSQVADAVMGYMAERGEITSSGNRVALAGRQAQLTADERDLLARLEALYRERAYQPPSPSEAAEKLKARGKTIEALVELLAEQGRLVRTAPGMHFHADAVASALKEIDRLAGQDPFTTSDARKRLGTSRKYIIPLLEYFDSAGLTARRGEARIRIQAQS